MLLIPAIDILDGRPVRLLRGDYSHVTAYDDSPLDAALRWAKAGATWLHVVDLDGARRGEIVNSDAIQRIIGESGLKVQVGGGYRSLDAIDRAFTWGAERVVLGTAAVKDSVLLQDACSRYPGQIVVAIDARAGEVAIEGWTESSGRSVLDVSLEVQAAGAGYILFTAIETDGSLQGPDLYAIQQMQQMVSIPIIASGGIGTLAHLEQLEQTGVHAVVVGRALYEGTIPLEAIRRFSS